jgi:hypothetical protein
MKFEFSDAEIRRAGSYTNQTIVELEKIAKPEPEEIPLEIPLITKDKTNDAV